MVKPIKKEHRGIYLFPPLNRGKQEEITKEEEKEYDNNG